MALKLKDAALMREQCYVDGAWCDADARATLIVNNPATGELVGTVPDMAVAKVARDAAMLELHAAHPGYGFDRHKGYATREHLAALQRHGACAAHRRSFAPVRMLIEPTLPVTAAGT